MEPDPLQEIQPRYQKIQTLGKGSFGFVQLARNASGEMVAVKLLKRGDVNKYVEAEIVNHSLLRHPHVIQFKEVFLTSEYICIAMEYATGGSLFHYVQKQGRLKEAVARWFFQQLIIGADYCHKRGVANRDIKLENTLLQVVKGLPLPLLKICDFGYSKADFKSAAKSKVSASAVRLPWGVPDTPARGLTATLQDLADPALSTSSRRQHSSYNSNVPAAHLSRAARRAHRSRAGYCRGPCRTLPAQRAPGPCCHTESSCALLPAGRHADVHGARGARKP